MRKHNFLFVFFADQGSLSQPRSHGSLLPVPAERERERDPGWVWSRGSRTKLIPMEESFVSQIFFVWFFFTVHTMIARAR